MNLNAYGKNPQGLIAKEGAMGYNADMTWKILGHRWAADMLQQHIAGGQMRHAYLFSGPNGVGRRTLALRFAQAVNCVEPPELGVPCGTCRACQQIAHMQQADLSVVQSKEEGEALKVDQVRDLQRALSLAPYESAYRIALLLRFEEATDGAQNALLKTLEEPNPKVLLLVTADDPENLLPTIVSRCETLRLRPTPLDVLTDVLKTNYHLSEDKARLIAHVACGNPGTALRLATDDEALSRRSVWLNEMLELLKDNRTARIRYVQERTNKKRSDYKGEIRDGLRQWLSLWRDVMLAASGSDAPLTNLDYQDAIQLVAQEVGERSAARLTARLAHSFARLNQANIPLMLDNLLLEWPHI